MSHNDVRKSNISANDGCGPYNSVTIIDEFSMQLRNFAGVPVRQLARNYFNNLLRGETKLN